MTKRFMTAMAASMLFVGALLPASAAGAESVQPVTRGVRQASGYSDVPEHHWAYASVAKLREAGVLAPDRSEKFRPADPVSRAEVLKMVLAARRVDTGSECEGFFRDAPCWAWYAPAVETAYRMGLNDGRSDGTFNPEGQVTRQELVTTLIRVQGLRRKADTLGSGEVAASLKQFKDSREISDWARPAVALALRSGLASGYDDGTFRPWQPTSRAEAAVAISRVLLASEGRAVAPSREGSRAAAAVESDDTVTVDGRQIHFKKAFKMTASMYSTGEPGVGVWTATGLRVRPGTVAVDPNVIPLGSLLYIEGYGYAIAADTGGAIKGNRIDLYTASYDQAIDFGLQPRRVWLLP